MELFSGISLLNLPALALALAAPLLILAYLKNPELNSRKVSSLFLLQSLPAAPSQKKKLKLPLRFFLELLSLLLLVVIATWPLLKDKSTNVALLVDNSMSMGAQDLSGSRLEEAKKSLKLKVTSFPNSSRFTIFTSSPRLKRLTSEAISGFEVKKIVDSISTSFAADSFASSAAEILSEEKFDSLIAISDQKSVLLDQNKNKTIVETITVGTPAENIFISSLRFNTENKPFLQASLGFSGEGAARGRANLFVSKDSKNWILSKEAPFELTESSGNQEIIFSLDQINPFYKLELQTNTKNNSLAADDKAWLAWKSAPGKRTLVISPEFKSAAQAGLDQISGLAADLISPENFAVLFEEDLAAYSLLIFHKSAPLSPPKIATLLILPPKDNSLFSARQNVSAPKITSWSEDHPVTSYLRVPLISPTVAQVLQVPSWASSVINIEQGSIFAAGESLGIRLAASGTELLPFEGKKTPAASIFLLNSINWLSGQRGLAAGKLSGSSLQVDGVITLPNGQETAVEKGLPFIMENPGPYKVADQTIMANAFYPDESETFTPGTYSLSYQSETDPSPGQGQRQLWRIVAMLVAAVLLADFALRQKSLGFR